MKKFFSIEDVGLVYWFLHKKTGCNKPFPALTNEDFCEVWKEVKKEFEK